MAKENKRKILSYDDILILLKSDGEHKKAKIIANALNRSLFMRKINDTLYVEDTERQYYCQVSNEQDVKDRIRNTVTLLMEESKDALQSDDKKDLNEMFGKKIINFSKIKLIFLYKTIVHIPM